MKNAYNQNIQKQIKRLELFPDKMYLLEAIRKIILEIKTSKDIFKRKKGLGNGFVKKKTN